MGRRPVRLGQPAGRGRPGGDPAAGLRRPVDPGAGPDQPDDARQPRRAAGLPAGRQPPARRSAAPPARRSTPGTLDLTTATVTTHVRAERRAVPAGGVRERAGPGDRGPADAPTGPARSPSPPRSTARSARPCPARTPPRSRSTASPATWRASPARSGSSPWPAPASPGGTVSSSGGTLRVSGATSVTAAGLDRHQLRQLPHASTATTRASRGRHLTAARTVGYDQLRARHVADYQALFGRVTIDLGRTAGGRPAHRRADRAARRASTTRSSRRCCSSTAATC